MAKFQNGADGVSGDIEAFVQKTVHELEASAAGPAQNPSPSDEPKQKGGLT